MNFIPPQEYITMQIPGPTNYSNYLDVAFVPVPADSKEGDCVAYLKSVCCKIMSLEKVMKVLNLLDDHTPQNGRMIVASSDGTMKAFSRNFAVTLHPGQPFNVGDVLLCCRDSTCSMSDFFPKGPFTGSCNMIRE